MIHSWFGIFTITLYNTFKALRYQRSAMLSRLKNHPDSEESLVWWKLCDEGQVELQKEFIENFRSKGFGFVKGSKFKATLERITFRTVKDYCTWDVMMKRENWNVNACKERARQAERLGKGKGKGWFIVD